MAFDTSARRKRYTRQPTGKSIRLSERDAKIFALLTRYRYLNTEQLLAFVQPQSVKRFKERLGDLFHETSLINRPAAQWKFPDAKCQHAIYEITMQGIEWLSLQGIKPQNVTLFSRRERMGVRTQFEHRLLVIDHLVRRELEILNTPNERFISIDEILSRAPIVTIESPNPLAIPIVLKPNQAFPELKKPFETNIIPDAVYGVERTIDGQKRYRFFAVEGERTSPKKRKRLDLSSTDKKQRLYAELKRQGLAAQHLGVPSLHLEIIQPKKNPA